MPGKCGDIHEADLTGPRREGGGERKIKGPGPRPGRRAPGPFWRRSPGGIGLGRRGAKRPGPFAGEIQSQGKQSIRIKYSLSFEVWAKRGAFWGSNSSRPSLRRALLCSWTSVGSLNCLSLAKAPRNRRGRRETKTEQALVDLTFPHPGESQS